MALLAFPAYVTAVGMTGSFELFFPSAAHLSYPPLSRATFPTPAYGTDNPGVNVAATEWLARQGIVHFGIDSMRPGPEGDVNSLVHKACLELNITHMESLCNLETLLGEGEFRFIGLPLKWREGTGSPIRAVAVFDF